MDRVERSRAGWMRDRNTLHALRNVQAPASLLPAVMTALSLGDAYTTIQTPIGEIFVAYNAEGISSVARVGDVAEFERHFQAQFGRPVYRASEPPGELAADLRGSLAGRRTRLRFDLRGLSEFERAVLLKALEIPRGEVRPYSWIAREIGRPKAVRAVGSALARNPIPLFIPCHRVVRSDGQFGEYSLGGPAIKRAVLTQEGLDLEAMDALSRAGVRYVGSATTHVFCLPTCHHARRISGKYLVRFPSALAAVAGGYRPCKVCRPAVGETA